MNITEYIILIKIIFTSTYNQKLLLLTIFHLMKISRFWFLKNIYRIINLLLIFK
jgi:hypothetical protein